MLKRASLRLKDNMNFTELAALHNRVTHIEKAHASESDIELEDIWVKKYPYDLLNNVCVDCFSKPTTPVDVLVPQSN